MSLNTILTHNSKFLQNQQQEITQERIDAQFDNIRNLIAFFREYPDIFIDFIKGPDCTFKFYYYQRIFLRVAMRHRYVYFTAPRAFSKSFLSMMILIIRAILYPNSELFVTTGGKLIIVFI